MSHLVFTNGHVSVNGVDLSDHVQEVKLDYSADEVEDTNMGDSTHQMLPGTLKNWTAEIVFSQDYAAGEVDATLFPIVGSAVTIGLRPVNTTVSATNPEYTGSGVLLTYPPIGGQVGEKMTTSATFKPGGSSADLARNTS